MFGRSIAAAILVASASFPGAASARPFCSDPPFVPLISPIGTSGSSVYEHNYDIMPGDVACFRLHVPGAARGHIDLAIAHNNGNLQLYPPGWVITQNGRSFTFGVPALPGTADSDNARSWTGQLPPQGDLLIVVAMKGNGRQYRVHVEADE